VLERSGRTEVGPGSFASILACPRHVRLRAAGALIPNSGDRELARKLYRCDHLCALTGAPSQIFRHLANQVGKYDVARTPTFAGCRAISRQDDARACSNRTFINPIPAFLSFRCGFRSSGGVEFIGCASANITVDVLSRFSPSMRASGADAPRLSPIAAMARSLPSRTSRRAFVSRTECLRLPP